jgi:GNAT superfamily N-acetyltransferase
MIVRNFLRKFQRNMRDYGWPLTAKKAVAYSFRWIYRASEYRVYRIDLADWQPRIPGDGSLQYCLITTEDRELIDQIETMEEWLGRRIAPKLRAGGLCLVAMDGENLVGFNLVGFGRLYILSLELHRTFRPQTAWSEQVSVSPGHRGRGVATELRNRMFSELKARGIRRFYGGTMISNVAALKLAGRVGFREIVDIHFRRVLWRRTWRYSRL